MKIQIATALLFALITASGCQSTNVSSKGGIVPINEEFSIAVPTPTTVAQGSNATINVTLNRGPYFKQDVKLVTKTDGITVTPASVVVKASDKPEVPLFVSVAREAAIGEYRVSVSGTPESGAATSTVFIVKVVAQ